LNKANQKSIEEIAREERLAYFKEWRANNKDRVKKYNAAYWQKRAIQKATTKENNIND
jgi:hypothetical protein